MPSIVTHLAGAKEIAERLAHPDIEAERGAYYLGATAPDLRSITRQPREETHFFTLEDLNAQDSVRRMFSEHAELRVAAHLNRETRAFLAGYQTHLIMDQRYIERIYREYFGSASLLGADAHADLLDRLLQYELDRREREDTAAIGAMREALAATGATADVNFIARETLQRWREAAVDMASAPATWERWPRTAGRHAGSEADSEQLLREVPALLREVIDHVTEARIREFIDQSIADATGRVAEYLQ